VESQYLSKAKNYRLEGSVWNPGRVFWILNVTTTRYLAYAVAYPENVENSSLLYWIQASVDAWNVILRPEHALECLLL